MLLHPKTTPDLQNCDASPTGALGVQPVGPWSETNLADVVASFAAQSAGALSPELSGVALEIVLNEIVEHACLTMGATGAAIILPIEGEMVCRASCGSTAPEVGDRLPSSGLFGDCIETRSTQRCDDILADSPANLETLQQLNVRSVILMPLILQADCTGIFGLFSSQPSAFGKSIEQTMEVLARRTLSNLRSAAVIAEGVSKTAQFDESVGSEHTQRSALRSVEVVTMALALFTIGCALLLGFLIGRHFDSWTTVRTSPQALTPLTAVGPTPVSASGKTVVAASGKEERADVIVQNPEVAKPTPAKSVPPGGLAVFEKGKEIFRMPPKAPPSRLTEQH